MPFANYSKLIGGTNGTITLMQLTKTVTCVQFVQCIGQRSSPHYRVAISLCATLALAKLKLLCMVLLWYYAYASIQWNLDTLVPAILSFTVRLSFFGGQMYITVDFGCV